MALTTPPKKADVSGSDGGDGSSGGALVMDRVLGALEFPMLGKGSYQEWALVMQVNLEAMGLWDAVESDDVERRLDRLALAAILRGVPFELKSGLAAKKSAKEAWESVKSTRAGDARVRDANAQTLLREFELVMFADGESVDEFALRLSTLVTNLRELGEKIEEERVVKKLLRVVPARLNQVALSIEMLMDLKTMKLEELVGRLCVAEQRQDVDAATSNVGRLLLTEEQWDARRRERRRARVRNGGARSSNARNDIRGKDGNSEEEDDAGSVSSHASRRSRRPGRGRCFNCGQRGHVIKDCVEPRKEKDRGERALLGDVEEPTLF